MEGIYHVSLDSSECACGTYRVDGSLSINQSKACAWLIAAFNRLMWWLCWSSGCLCLASQVSSYFIIIIGLFYSGFKIKHIHIYYSSSTTILCYICMRGGCRRLSSSTHLSSTNFGTQAQRYSNFKHLLLSRIVPNAAHGITFSHVLLKGLLGIRIMAWHIRLASWTDSNTFVVGWWELHCSTFLRS